VFGWKPGKYVDANGKIYESPYGHTSVLTQDGTYLSHHPKKLGLNQFGSFFRSYEQDRSLYGRPPDFATYVQLPDESAASAFAKEYLQNEKFWGPYGNCTDAVTDTLNAGGLSTRNLTSGALDFISYPEELFEEIRGMYWTNKSIYRDCSCAQE
jgi:hypothetical protein